MRLPGGGQATIKSLLRRLYCEYENDGVADNGAALSYYFVFSLFPFLFFIATLAAFVPQVGSTVFTVLDRIRPLVPGEAMSIVDQQARSLIGQPRPKLLTLGLIITLYSASRGVDAVRKALNLAYDVKETRPVWKTELVAFGMTMGGAILVLAAIAILIAGGS